MRMAILDWSKSISLSAAIAFLIIFGVFGGRPGAPMAFAFHKIARGLLLPWRCRPYRTFMVCA